MNLTICQKCHGSKEVELTHGGDKFKFPCSFCTPTLGKGWLPFDKAVLNPLLDDPKLDAELTQTLDALSLLRFFPKDFAAQVGVILLDMCNTSDELRWVRDAALLAWNDWPGPRDLRALFCQRFRPKDGIEVSLERPISRSFNSEEVETLRRLPYGEYLQSNHWKILRSEKLRDATYRCQLCNGSETLEVHHRTYQNRGREPLSDLTVLCGDCHGKFHNELPAGEM